MITTQGLKLKLQRIPSIPGDSKLICLYQIRDGINLIEKQACKDPGFPLTEIREAQGLLPRVNSSIRTLERSIERRKK